MIVSLSREVCEQIATVDTLRKAQDEGKNLRDTLDLLEKIKPELFVLAGSYKLIRPRLPTLDVAKLDAQFGQMEQHIKGSQQSFAAQRRQVTALAPVLASELPLLRRSIAES